MAVTIRGSQTYESGSGGYVASHTLTDIDVTGTDTLALAAGFNRNPLSDVTSWTFEGNTPTAVLDSINTNVVAVSTQRYLISNAATTIVSNTPSFKLQAMIGLALEGVDQTTPIAGTGSGGSYGTAATASYTGTSGNMLFVFVSTQNDRTFTASGVTDITSVTHADGNLGSGYAGYVTATGSSQTIGATLSSADNWRLVIVEVAAAASGTTLIVNDLSTTPTLEAPALTQANTLVVQDTSTTPTLETPTLTGVNIDLIVANLSITPTLESPALTQANTLTAANLSTGTTLDTPALTQANTLAVSDVSTTPTLETTSLTQANTLTVANLSTTPTLEAVAVTQAHTLAVADISSTPTLEAVVVDATLILNVADLSVQSSLDNVALTQASTLSVQDVSLTPTVDVTYAIVPSLDSPILTPVTISREEEIAVVVQKETEISLVAAQTTSSIAANQEGSTINIQQKPSVTV